MEAVGVGGEGRLELSLAQAGLVIRGCHSTSTGLTADDSQSPTVCTMAS